MIKKFSLFALSLVGCLVFQACSDSFLDEDARDKNYADNLFEDLDGFVSAKNALLHMVRVERSEPIQSAELGIIWKIGTDVAWANSELSWSRGLNQYTAADLTSTMQFLNGDTSGNPGIFLLLYKGINAANMIINRAKNPDVDWMGADETENRANRNLMVAHAHLVRAWCYRHLAYTFGPVPISTEEITGSNYRDDWTRDPVEDIQELMEEDLLFAAEWLPVYSGKVEILSRAVAQHYLAELYLWMNRPSDAEKYARLVVDNPNYKLITERYGVNRNEPGCPFMDQFLDGNILPGNGNTEALWVFPNTPVDGTQGQYGNSMRRSWISAYHNLGIPITPQYGGRGLGRASITAWVFSLYEEQDDRFSEYAIHKAYVVNDKITLPCDMDAGSMTSNNHKWASTRKWDWTFEDSDRWGELYAYGHQTYLRIADTYLLLAEALHLQGKNSESDGAAYYLNLIRTRSNATPITVGEVSLDFILDERARELVTEEHRRETLVRTGKLVERTRKYNPIASGERDGGAGIQDHHVLLPIPQIIMDANVGHRMEQNEGYQ
ncbi:MAG: RagB/SusD family nutrient uptake outer membrane protein [Bacteroides sp.]|nr:RagB/SusD family nutrient uptake outer membrane protein [Bacteroides sp.]